MSHNTTNLEHFAQIDFSVMNQLFLADEKSITMEGTGYGFLSCEVQSKGAQNVPMKDPRPKTQIFQESSELLCSLLKAVNFSGK